MGFIKTCLLLMAGILFGVYVAQNYDVSNIRKLAGTGILICKHIEETYRKPKKSNDDD